MLDTLSFSCYHFSKRSPRDCRINGYNTDMLKYGFANMDMKLIASPRSCVEYLTKYMFKSEPTRENEESNGYSKYNYNINSYVYINLNNKAILLSRSSIVAAHVYDSDETSDFDNFNKYCHKIRSDFCNTRKVTLNEILWMNAGLSLKEFSNRSLFASVGGLISKYAMVQRNNEALSDTSNDLYGVFDWQTYVRRPTDLDQLCFADFVTTFEKIKTVDLTQAANIRRERLYDLEIAVCVKGEKLIRFFKKYDRVKTLKYNFPDWGMQKSNDEVFYVFFHPWREEGRIKRWNELSKSEVDRIQCNWKKHRYYQASFDDAMAIFSDDIEENDDTKTTIDGVQLLTEEDTQNFIGYTSTLNLNRKTLENLSLTQETDWTMSKIISSNYTRVWWIELSD